MGPRKKAHKKLSKEEQAELDRITTIYELYDSSTKLVDGTLWVLEASPFASTHGYWSNMNCGHRRMATLKFGEAL